MEKGGKDACCVLLYVNCTTPDQSRKAMMLRTICTKCISNDKTRSKRN